MSDDITIGVTEIVNNIEVTAQPNDQIVDISVTDNADNVTLNITPTVIEINVNKGSSYAKWGDIYGTLSDQTDLQNALNLKANLVGGKVPASELPSYVDDIIEVANYAALPATGEIGKIYVTLDNNKIYRWSGSVYIEIASNSAIWGAITGTLSSQTDLVNALNLRVPYTGATSNVNLGEYGLTSGFLGLDTTPTSTPTGIGTIYWDAANRTAALIDGDGDTTLQIGQEQRILVHNNTGSTLTDGQVVYVTGSTGNLPSVSLANASSETTSAATLGVVTESIANGADGFITTSGIVNGLNTLAFNEGDLLWLGTTAGTFTATKPISPNHLVLIGYVIKKAGGNGSILVKIQNTQELEESSDVLFTSLTNKDFLVYESATDLWKNKSIATILGYTPANDASVVKLTGDQSIAGDKTFTTANRTTFQNADFAQIRFKNTGDLTKYLDIGYGSNGNIFSTTGLDFRVGGLTTAALSIASNENATFRENLTAKSFIKSGGTSLQFLKADGSVDSTTYQTALTNPITGTGTTNYIPKFTGASAIGNSLIYDNGTNVGIGTASPLSKLHIEGDNSSTTDETVLTLRGNGENGKRIDFRNAFGSLARITGTKLAGGASADEGILIFETAINSVLSEKMRITSGGNVGIGTTTDAGYKLDVNGTGRFSGNTSVGTINLFSNGIIRQDVSGTTFTQYWYSGSSLGTINTDGANISYNATNAFTLGAGGSERMRITSGGNVLIGTSTDSGQKLSVSGNISLDTGGYIYGDSTTTSLRLSQTNGSFLSYGSSGIALYGSLADIYSTDRITLQTNNTERMRITSGGNVGIGTTSPTAKLTVSGTQVETQINNGDTNTLTLGGFSGGRHFIKSINLGVAFTPLTLQASSFTFDTGNVGIGTTSPSTKLDVVGAITASGGFFNSDMRLKDLTDYDYNVSDIKPITYLWKDGRDNKKHVGYSAQEVQKVMPDAVNEGTDGMLSVNYVEVLVAQVNFLTKRIEELEKIVSK